MLLPIIISFYCNLQIYCITRRHVMQINSVHSQLQLGNSCIQNSQRAPQRVISFQSQRNGAFCGQLQRNANFQPQRSRVEGYNVLTNRKSAVTFAIITLLSVISFLPNFSFTIYLADADEWCDVIAVLGDIWPCSDILLFVGCALNPLVYGLRCKVVRNEVIRLFKCTALQCT